MGLKIVVKVTDNVWLDAGYKRYEMAGLDSITASDVYPKANVFSGGVILWF